MKRYLDIYKDFVVQYLKILMQSKANFFIGFIGFICTQASGILFLTMIFSQIPNLNGWSFYEILFIYGFAQLPRGLDHLFSDYIWMFSMNVIVRGEFDRYLLRPLNPLFQVLAETLQLDALGELFVGIIIVVISVLNLDIQITFLRILSFILVIVAGSIIYTAIKLFFASFAFWIKESITILNIVYMFSDFTKYPTSIYSKGVQIILNFIIPFAFTAFIPASYFLNKSSFVYAVIGTCIVAIISFAIAYATWLKGIGAYESSGN